MGLQVTDPERVDENAGLIAQHYERAGDALRAAEWHQRAIAWVGLRDPMASIRHALQIVELDDDLPDNETGDFARVTARLYVATMGWRVGADPAVIRNAYDEGVLIARRLGDEMLLTLLHASFAACPVTCEGKLQEGYEIAMEAVRLADEIGDPGLRAMVRTFPSYLLWVKLRLVESLSVCDEIAELTAGNPEIPFRELVGSPRAWMFIVRGPALYALGRPTEGRQAIEESIAFPYGDTEETLGWAHMFAAAARLSGGDIPAGEVAEHAHIAFEIAERLGDAFSRTWAQFWIAYAEWVSGNARSAVENFTRALSEIEERGAGREASAGIYSGLGSALVAVGEVERGIEAGRKAAQIATEQGHSLYELVAREALAVSLLHRGEEGDVDEAAGHLRAALTLAERAGHVPYVERINEHLERIPTTA